MLRVQVPVLEGRTELLDVRIADGRDLSDRTMWEWSRTTLEPRRRRMEEQGEGSTTLRRYAGHSREALSVWHWYWAFRGTDNCRAKTRSIDVGCGVTPFPDVLRSAFTHAEGMDAWPEGTSGSEEAAGLWPGVVYHTGRIEEGTTFGRRYDFVSCLSVLEHLEDGEVPRAVLNLVDLLVPGGVAAITVDVRAQEGRRLFPPRVCRDWFGLPISPACPAPEEIERLWTDHPPHQLPPFAPYTELGLLLRRVEEARGERDCPSR